MINYEKNIEGENNEALLFSNTVDKFNSSQFSEGYLNVGFHPNRTTSTIFGMTETKTAEVLSVKRQSLWRL